MAVEEDAFWETGKCSGTMYCGDHEHYAFLNEAFGLFAHVNALQRDMCPSATRFEGEIIAMALDLMHADAVERQRARRDGHHRRHRQHPARDAGLPRARGQGARHRPAPNFVKPETGAPGLRQGLPPVRDRAAGRCRSTRTRPWSDVGAVAAAIDENTIAIVGLGRQLPLRHHRPDRRARRRSRWSAASACTSTAAWAASSCPSARSSATTCPPFDFRVPGVTIDLRRHPQVRLRVQGHLDAAVPRQGAAQRAVLPHRRLERAASTCRPGIEGSRSGGLLAATWASMVHLRPRGLPRVRRGHLRDRRRMKDVGPVAPRAADHGQPDVLLLASPPTSSTSTTSPTSCGGAAGASTASSTPNAIHMAVTRPQTQPGVVDAFEADLAEAVPYAVAQAGRREPAAAVGRDLRWGRRRADRARSRSSSRWSWTDMLDTQQARAAR